MKWMIIPLLSLFMIGCATSKVNTSTQNNKIVSMINNDYTRLYHEDHWDYFIRGVRNGTVVFTWSNAIVCYLISNVKIGVIDHGSEYKWYDELTIYFIIFRWSF